MRIMERQTSEARDVFLIGAAFLAYALLLWAAARREALGTALSAFDVRRLEFARSQRDRIIAEENANGD